jgi:hypothetical protein
MDSNTEPTPIAGTPSPGQPPAHDPGMPPATPAPAATGPASPSAGPAPAVVPARRAGRDPLPVVLALAALVAVGGISFAAGRLTAPTAAARTGLSGAAGLPGNGQRGGLGNGQGNGQGLPGNGFGNLGRALGGGLAIRGTVTAVAADHITIRTDSGQTVDIPTGASTTYHRQAPATSTDVTAGTPVVVQLEPNAAGAGQPGPSTGPNASGLPGGLGRFIGTARDITIVAQ